MGGFSLTLLTYQNKYHCPCLAISHYERHILKLTFLSFWRLISFIIFILCFLSHNYIFSLWGNAGIPDQTVVVWLFSCMVDFVMSLQLSPVKLPKNLLCFGLQSFVSILFQSDSSVKNIYIILIVVGTLNLINIIWIVIIPARNCRSHCFWNAFISMVSFNQELTFYLVIWFIERFITEQLQTSYEY